LPSSARTAPASRPAPPCHPPTGPSKTCHNAGITPDTIIPPWYGERLDLDHAIYTCFANAEYHARERDQAHQHGQAGQPDQQPASTTAPEDEPRMPVLTEVDIIAGIRELCQEHAHT